MVRQTVLALAALFVGGLVWSAERAAEKKDLPLDQEFARKVAQINAGEVKLGRLALEQSSNPRVRAFAEKLVKEHGDANGALRVAVGKNVVLPQEVSAECKECFDKLSRLKGPEFDKAYMQEQVKGHEMAVKLFENEIANGKDPQIKEFAARTLPAIKDHLRAAQDWIKAEGR
jgi:putative membrane protein